MWGWGHNPAGQVGAGRTSYNVDPAVRAGGLPPVTAVAGGYAHSLALTAAGEVWSTGWNANGQLGDGTTISRSSFAPVPELSGVVQVAAGGYLSLALSRDGTVWAWGTNLQGQLGHSDIRMSGGSLVPRSINLPRARALASGTFHGLAVTDE